MIFIVFCAAFILIAALLYYCLHNPKRVSVLYDVFKRIVFPVVRCYQTVRHLFTSKAEYESIGLPVLLNVYLSLSATPGRIKTLHQTLANLAGQAVEVHLNLPRLFRNQTPYNIEEVAKLQTIVPNLRVYWMEQDIGPAAKLLPTLERLLDADKMDAIVITVDDDILLPTASLSKFVEIARKSKSVATQYCGVYGGTVDGVHYTSVFGNRGVAYPVSIFTKHVLQTMRTIQTLKECKMHDDMGIAMALHKHKIPIVNVDLDGMGSGLDLPQGYTEESISFKEIVNFRDRDTDCIQAALRI